MAENERIIELVKLKISNDEEFKLYFSQLQRFATCRLSYKSKDYELDLSEDYLYIFVENMLGRLTYTPTIESTELFGKIGKWQEFFYYNDSDIMQHSAEINKMKKSTFVSAENYGMFLYKYNGKVWLEINRGYGEDSCMSPLDFYNDPANYQLLLRMVSENILCECKKILGDIQKKIKL